MEGVGQHDPVALLRGTGLHSGTQGGKIGIGNVRDDDTDGVGLLPCQSPGRDIRHIVQRLTGIMHRFSGSGPDGRMAVQHPGHRAKAATSRIVTRFIASPLPCPSTHILSR